ncbi:MAG: Patatin [Chloroflexi bacterium]|nr:Patatin [Chloroflexota bacterium]
MATTKDPNSVLVLQGGGALGAYHIGAYRALHEAGFAPGWICGTSIGALNAAVLVGNRPQDRVERLEEFWDEISWPDLWGVEPPQGLERAFNTASNLSALMFGQPNFFGPYVPGPYLSLPGRKGATSFYDTSPMLRTLTRLADFAVVNSGATRISLGATNVTTGNVRFFDNKKRSSDGGRDVIGPAHALASGSLPPGFPATEIDGESYWDGGCVSNTPLDAVLNDLPTDHTVVFMVDLWDAAGPVPETIDQVMWRQKNIQYASRTAHHITEAAERVYLRSLLTAVRSRVPKDALDDPAIPNAPHLGYEGKLDIVHVVYRPTDDQISSSDAEFSRSSIAKRSKAGYEDLKLALRHAPWVGKERPAAAVVVHRVVAGNVTRHVPTWPGDTAQSPGALTGAVVATAGDGAATSGHRTHRTNGDRR